MLCIEIGLEDLVRRIAEKGGKTTNMLDDEHSTDALPEVLAFVDDHEDTVG